jgi:outer membrane protein OmpA-like peptidoglycan-associated protein
LKEEVTYYKGILRSQFSTFNSRELGKDRRRVLSQIKLEPIFELHAAELISEEEFLAFQNSHLELPFIRLEEKIIVEYQLTNEIDAKRMYANVLFMGLEKEPSIVSLNEIDWKELNLDSVPAKYLKECFIAYVNGTSHGRICGPVVLKRTKQLDDKGIENFSTSNSLSGDILSQNKGCLNFLSGFFSVLNKIYLWFQSRFNFISSRIFGLNNNVSNGTPNSGCLNFGCGLISLLLALSFLAWLVYSLFFGGNNNQNSQNERVVEKIIHDTIYIQKDSKVDTVTYLDETTKTTVKMLSLPNVQFEKNKAILLKSSIPQLNQLAIYLLENKSIKAEIIGHTDSDGDATENKKLSKSRADKVRMYLIQNSVQPWRVITTGKGESEPITENKTAEGRAMNRRVEVKLSTTGSTKTTRKKEVRVLEE